MVNPKRLLQLAKKWQRMAANKRRRLTLPRRNVFSGWAQPTKGHFVVYTLDEKRFVIPLEYLNKDIFRELLRLSAEELGISCDTPITLPCDSSFLDYFIGLVQRHMPDDLVKALLIISEGSQSCRQLSGSSSLRYGQFVHQQERIHVY